MNKHIAISVLGKDRPGIVSCVTKVLFECGCNIEDSSMTQLRSEFAMILLVTLPKGLDIKQLDKKMIKAASALELSVLLRPITQKEDLKEKAPLKPFTISLYGADKPGIVYNISNLLSENNVNITDVQTNVLSSSKGKTYVMFLEVSLPNKLAPVKLKSLLLKTAKKLGVSATLNSVDTPTL